MNKATKRIMAVVLILMLLISGLPSEIKSFAAPQALSLSVGLNTSTQKYEISYIAPVQPAFTVVTFHKPDGTLDTLTGQEAYDSASRKVTVSVELLPDHIYDISVDAYQNATDPAPSHQGKIYYLADITFTGESFNEMAKMSDIEDKAPELELNASGSAITVRSGNDPVIKLKWKIPTIFNTTKGIIYLTDKDKAALKELEEAGNAISTACFQINMTVGHGTTRMLDFNTDYSGSSMIIEGKNTTVAGISDGNVTSTDKFVSVILKKEQGIEPGTEYEFTNIGVIFENSLSEQIPVRRTKLRTDSNNRFMVTNIDNAFSDTNQAISSIYTPLQMELTKVDTDKVEVRFKKITNGVYPELYYQVQYASRIDDLYTQTERWVKIPDSSLPASQAYGSEIVTIPIPGTAHPEYYFRVVYYDSSSVLPRSSSLCVDLRLLGTDAGKPPLPREIKAEPLYVGRKNVTVPNTELSSGVVEIPASDLRLSFEKPLAWKLVTSWDAFMAQPYTDEDYTFHVLLSTYLPESKIETQTKTIGFSSAKDIYLPVKQKRMLVLGKKNFSQDPNNPNRLICTIPGDKLFYDYVSNKSLDFENNEDPSEDGNKGDYPIFLVPNTTYYMQVFTSRLKDNADIDSDVWGDRDGLAADINNRLSYKSPVYSFTTWPLTELPVPMPNIQLDIAPKTNVDPAGNLTLAGISVNYERVLTNVEWQRYTGATTGRAIDYEIYISRDASQFSDVPVAIDNAPYPGEAERIQRGVTITSSGIVMGNGQKEPIMPNTVYYIKARSSLVVGGDVIGRSAFTAVKAITTPKIDSGGLDNNTREPRSPSEFSIAVGPDGELLLSDAKVTLNWLHAESDVTYEMICTSTNISPQAVTADYASDSVNISFLNAYNEFRSPPGDSKLHLDVKNTSLNAKVLTLDENGSVVMLIDRTFLKPNRTYYFSLRAVRKRGVNDPSGNSLEKVSRWITIPVTTRMVKEPAFLEAVKDLEVGFNIQCSTSDTMADSMEVYLKKAGTADSQYVRLNRSQYTCVKDGSTFYFRIYNLESDQWYDIRVKNKVDNRWYNTSGVSWSSSPGSPIQAKTRNAMKEIEVRWEGEAPYTYFLEARTDSDTDYEKLSPITYYREKTNLYVEEKSPHYIYYAIINKKPVRDEDGILHDLPLKSNTLYYVKLWAYNVEESIHIGPVTARTDFSQDDYDDDQKEDDVIDLFENEADNLTKKQYWRVDIKEGTSFRAILKDDQISGLLQAARESTVTVDLSSEQTNTTAYEILIPYKTLEAIEKYDSRLNLKLLGAEITLNKGSIDLAALKTQAMVNSAKEPMLLLKVYRTQDPQTKFPTGFTSASRVYDLEASTIGSRLTYGDLKNIIHDILKKPDAKGPFKYGILDRELSLVLKNLDSYSYRTHTDLKDLIKGVMVKVEKELSRYLKDIIDGGSGLSSNTVVTKGITSFPGKIGVKLEYTYRSGLITPYVNYGSGWKEPSGAKGYVMQYALFRAEKPGEYAVVGSGTVTVQPGSPFEETLSKLSSQYDLSKVFGKGTLYPANPVTGEQAVMLYAVLTRRDGDITGMTPVKKASTLGIGDVMGAKQLNGYVDNQTSVSLAVKLYCSKANINPSLLKPSKTINIANGSLINTSLYKYVVLGVDLNLTTLENKKFDAVGRTTTGMMLDMMSKALEKFGK